MGQGDLLSMRTRHAIVAPAAPAALQYRPDKGCCTHRLFNEDNSTYFGDPWVYGERLTP